MKIAAQVSDGVYLAEISRHELARIMGEQYYCEEFKTGQTIPISNLWKIITETRARLDHLQKAAANLRTVAASIDYAAATLDPPPAPAQTDASS